MSITKRSERFVTKRDKLVWSDGSGLQLVIM